MTSFYNVESLKTIAKKEVPAANRLARIIFKKDRKTGVEKDSKGLWVPAITDNMVQVVASHETGAEYLRNVIAGVQDALIRKLIENGKLVVSRDEIDVDRIIAAMAAVNETERFSKESIKLWFVEHMTPALTAAIRNKMTGISDSKLNQLLANYLDSFQVLAGRNPSMNNDVKAGLIRAMEFLPEDHDAVTAQEIARRLAEVQEATAMLAAL